MISLKFIFAGCVLLATTLLIPLPTAEAAEVVIRIDNPPESGTVTAMLFSSSSTFADLRDPLKDITLSFSEPIHGSISDLPGGEYALVVYHDENGNGRLDKNFIGIPNEPLGFSNRYWPKGPPTFRYAAFSIEAGETRAIDVKSQPVFGKSGLFGVGVGAISKTSPYRDADNWSFQPIPAISYIGERLQFLGLKANYGIVDLGAFAVAATAGYRFGAYNEKDSSYLDGMGDREDTLLGGAAVHFKLSDGYKISAGYEHDLLDRIGGGVGRIGLEKSFQKWLFTLTPKLSLSWLSPELTRYEFGVSADQSRSWRPAYDPGDAVDLELGLNLFRELSKDWRIIFAGSVILLPSNLTDSPIVDSSLIFNSFLGFNRMF